MSRPIISVQNLSKAYRIGLKEEIPDTLMGALTQILHSPLRNFHQLRRLDTFAEARNGSHNTNGSPPISGDTLWALRHVSFDVADGEVLGIIGRNGAGKSTLLKVLSRITEPTSGRAVIRGRVSSLLEVGTGFHPELSGRENIYMNGTILGMTKREIDRKFDEIVDFSGVEQFLDTPVKRYSSGMKVRLAFAVAAHLEPEILIIDEVLAVGDAEFQKKCLGKMQSVAQGGRTVLFVSHNLGAVQRLCNRALLLADGAIVQSGETTGVIKQYLAHDAPSTAQRIWPGAGAGDTVARLKRARITDGYDQLIPVAEISQELKIQIDYEVLDPAVKSTAVIHIYDQDDICLFASNGFNDRDWWESPRRRGQIRATCTIPGHFLAEGRFTVLVAVTSYNPNLVHALERDALAFEVVDHTSGDGARGPYLGAWPGVVRPLLNWNVTRL